MNWLKKNSVLIIVNIIALLPILTALSIFRFDFSGSGAFITTVLPERILNMQNSPGFSGKVITALGLLLHTSGEWSIRWLTVCLTITPLSILFGWTKILRYKKTFGLYAFGYALAHTLFFIGEKNILAIFDEFNFIFGLIAVLIMTILALTSNKWSIKKLGRNWKILQQFTYFAAIFAILHLILIGKGGWLLYAAIIGIGFILRIPNVKEYFQKSRNQTKKTEFASELE